MSNQRFLDGNREVILRYLDAGGEGVELNDVQKKLLDRWRYADEVIRQSFFGKYKLREDIANAIMIKFDVSRDTAYRDIVNAEHVFSSSAPLNKKYLIQRRIEFICSVIAKLTSPVYDLEDETKVLVEFEPENAEIAAKWEAVLQKYVEKYPDYVPMRSPKTIVFNIQNNLLLTDLTPEQAAADAIIIIDQMERDEAI